MSIAVLTQAYDEMRRLAIAGANLAGGDFRLKKLAGPLEQAAAKSPVFGKVAEAVQKLVDSSPNNSAAALLELSTLVSAILYTQGETGAEGKLQPIETTDLGLPASHASARVLKPLIEALASTGSGRQEIIVDAHQRGAFKDLRLVRPAVQAIDDGYGEIADFVADKVLPMYGKAIYGDLKSSYNPKGKGGHVRRLKLMHRLDPEATRELVEQALESGSKEMKIAAIECLAGSNEALPYLLEQSKARSVDVRRAALHSLAKFTDDEALETLIKALSGPDVGLVAGAVSQNRSPKLLAYVLQEAERQFAELLGAKGKAKVKQPSARFYHLLSCLASRDDKLTLAFLTRCFEQRDDIGKLKLVAVGDYSGRQINRRVASLLVQSNSQPARKMVVDAHATLEPEVLDCALLAAVRMRKPKKVYDLFAPYYLAKTDGKKKSPAWYKRESVRGLLEYLASPDRCSPYYYRVGFLDDSDEPEDWRVGEQVELDPRWLDAAIQTGDLEMVMTLARPKHQACRDFLSHTFAALLNKKGDLDHQASNILDAMIRIEHPRTVEHFLDALQKMAGSRRAYYLYWLARLIPELPPDAAPKIEALLPSLPEKSVDQIAPFLAELQTKT